VSNKILSYGMTECSSTATSQPVDELDRIGMYLFESPFEFINDHVAIF
jgi:hypothetical protein